MGGGAVIGYEDLVARVAVVRRSAVGLVTVTGPDARSFLQSLISQDIDGLDIGSTAHSLLLEPQGKLVADFLVVRVDDDEYWLRCEPLVAPQLAAGLSRWKIRVKVDIADRSGEVACVTVRGPGSVDLVVPYNPDVRRVEVSWPESPGHDLIGPPTAIDTIVGLGYPVADEEALDVVRIEARVPRQPDDIDETTIAQEAFLDASAVSFDKGCFVGQELVCRIDSRGHVNRTLRRLRSDEPFVVGSSITAENPTGVDRAKVVGEVTSAAVSPRNGPIALATLRREVDQHATVFVHVPETGPGRTTQVATAIALD